jgi:hypothetical protein
MLFNMFYNLIMLFLCPIKCTILYYIFVILYIESDGAHRQAATCKCQESVLDEVYFTSIIFNNK